jgi:hypothetical protein
MLAVTGSTPAGRLNVMHTTPTPATPPMCQRHIGLCSPPQRHLDALATDRGEIRGKKGRPAMLLSAQKELVELIQSELLPGGSTVIALPAALGLFNITQQCIHFQN